MRGATVFGRLALKKQSDNFNPRAPCGARPVHPRDVAKRQHISTHAPLAGRDLRRCGTDRSCRNFNPRAPCGARRMARASTSLPRNFNPRAPCGARQKRGAKQSSKTNISTHAPLAGRDVSYKYAKIYDVWEFQPTRPLRGATPSPARAGAHDRRFQPTRPLRGATLSTVMLAKIFGFQPTRPLRGATP